MYFYVFVLTLSFILPSNSGFAMVTNYLKLSPNNKENTKVTLPFKYKDFSDRGKININDTEMLAIPLLVEGFWCNLNNVKDQEIIVGPLNPCHLIVITDGKNTVVFHKEYINNLQSLIDITKKEINTDDQKSIFGLIFTNKRSENEYNKHKKETSEGRSQLEEITYLKNMLIKAFNIEDRKQISAKLFESGKSGKELGDYCFAPSFVWVKIADNGFEVCNTCPMKEGLLGDFNDVEIINRLKLFRNLLDRAKNIMFKQLAKKPEVGYDKNEFTMFKYF